MHGAGGWTGSLIGVRTELPFLVAATLLRGIAVAARFVLLTGERSSSL
jgi:hypothetical protein